MLAEHLDLDELIDRGERRIDGWIASEKAR